MKIIPNQTFLDGHNRYEPGQEYEVDDRDGARFVGNGWATSDEYALPGAESATEVVTIQPNNVVHETRTEESSG